MKVLGWYVVDAKDGVDAASGFERKDEAEEWAKNADHTFPYLAPHRAALLAEIDESEIPSNGTIISETLKHEAGRSIDIAKNNERFLKDRRK